MYRANCNFKACTYRENRRQRSFEFLISEDGKGTRLGYAKKGGGGMKKRMEIKNDIESYISTDDIKTCMTKSLLCITYRIKFILLEVQRGS